jgi:hypothetical protein
MTIFINPNTSKIQYNKTCRHCVHECKQSYRSQIISCAKYKSVKQADLSDNKVEWVNLPHPDKTNAVQGETKSAPKEVHFLCPDIWLCSYLPYP